MKSLSKSLIRPLFLALLALVAFHPGQAAAATLDTPWSGGGTGTANVVSDGTTADPRLDYDAPGAFDGEWSYSAVAGSTRSVPLEYEASGFYGWYQVQVRLERFVQRSGVDVLRDALAEDGPTDCCSAPSGGFAYKGTTTFDVQRGDVYGFRIVGTHFTAGAHMYGSLMVHEVDDSAPRITPVVTGQKGDGGFYTGPATVKWNVQDDGSRITDRTGCDDVTVAKDTDGKGQTFTCSATSRGGTATESVTVKRDATAPELTVPSAVVKQADGSSGAVVSYEATATDALDASPKVTCSPASGTRLALGTTTVSCTAKDAAGNGATKTFEAIVFPTATTQVSPAPASATSSKTELQKINAVLSFRFKITKQTTRLVQLKVKNVPAGATVTVTCQGNHCPKKLKGKGLTLISKGTSVSLATLVKTGLKSGTTINVAISSPGAVTSVKTLVVRKGKAPMVGSACRPPGSQKAVAC